MLAIWEGTTNVLSLDMLRAFEKEKGFEAMQKDLGQRLAAIQNPEAKKILTTALVDLGKNFESAMKAGGDHVTANARGFSMTLTRLYIGSLLWEFAESTGEAKDRVAAQQWLLHRSLKIDLKSLIECSLL